MRRSRQIDWSLPVRQRLTPEDTRSVRPGHRYIRLLAFRREPKSRAVWRQVAGIEKVGQASARVKAAILLRNRPKHVLEMAMRFDRHSGKGNDTQTS